MKVNTDGVLLGAWVQPRQAKTILDIGTGTGLIALMLAQKSEATVEAIEIDRDAYLQASQNFSDSQWCERIMARHIAFQDYYRSTTAKFDVIVSNPPFFSKSLKSTGKQKSIARHNDSLPFEELVAGSAKLLHENGQIYVILPITELETFLSISEKAGLRCYSRLLVKPRTDKPVARVLMMLKKINTDATGIHCKTDFTEPDLQTISIENFEPRTYTAEYKLLTKDYYLAF